ncbi:MAG TPA: efflux RND transporter periplasmic adaptor subunit [Rhodopila sp.]|nr:efflux RND transporter periplasmic adaptor subunit [Rhodopila sp.]
MVDDRQHGIFPRSGHTVARALAYLLGTALSVPAFGAPPPPSVTVATVQVQNVAPNYSYIGRVTAIQSVQVMPRVTAFIDDVPVKQGSDVRAGEILFQLQKSQYQAALTAAQAQLESAQAGVKNAQLAYDRALRLNKQGFEAQSDLDQATANLQQAQATVLSAQANVQQAALNLSYCTISSPIDGRIGAVTLTKGNLVTPTTAALATVNQLDPIRVVFSVGDNEVVSAEKNTTATQDQIAAGLVVHLTLPDGSQYPLSGKIAFLSNQVDTQTGTVSVYADFANPQKLLLPGAFVNVDVRRSQPEEHPLVPVAAVQTDQKGSYVLVVGADNKVKQQPIKLGRQIAQNEIVTSGLSGGERVIVAGVQKVRPGETVNPTEAPPPPQDPPATAESGGARNQGG